ncbi:MAG TPA: response regulator [Vicinamibacterales bacterium]
MTRSVLIVDDSLTVRMDLADAFREAGFDVRLCSSAAQAVDTLQQGPIDVCVLDVQLPDGDGIDLLRGIRQSTATASTVVVMLSTEAEVKDRILGLRTGADEYVGKPYDTAYLVARVQELLAQREPVEASGTTVLVIDDSVTFRETLREALASLGYQVLAAPSGEEGLRLAGARRPDALVVDSMLPGMDGSAVIRRMRLDAALRDLPCVLLTGSGDPDAELRALDAGADTFVRKEEELDVILARVSAVLRRTADRVPGEEVSSSLLGPKKILAVDDSATYLHELAEALRGEGYDVVLARSGEEALELLAVQPVDCILLDLVMPGLDGRATCERIKTAPVVREIPLIILTATENSESMIQGLAAGADDYISKSNAFEVLKARVRAQIRRKQFEDEHRRIRERLLRKELEAAEARAAKQLAETRGALVQELERKNRELEAFSYSVSHDLRAPLRAIDGFSAMLADSLGDTLDPTAQGHLQRVRAAAKRMGELIDDLLELSRVGRADLRRTPCDLSALAQAIVADLRHRDPDRQVAVTIADGMVVDGDRGLMKAVLENLLGNSWKFTSTTDQPRIECGCKVTADGKIYFVRDNGAGFDMAYVEKLFRPFQRLHNTEEFPGTGIGLATTYRIIDRHGGRVWAEGEVGRGASIYFTVPPARPGISS